MSIDINKNYSEAVNKIRISQQSKQNKKLIIFLNLLCMHVKQRTNKLNIFVMSFI